jgi:hypothetical protein
LTRTSPFPGSGVDMSAITSALFRNTVARIRPSLKFEMVQKLQSAMMQGLKTFRTGPHKHKGERFTGSLCRAPLVPQYRLRLGAEPTNLWPPGSVREGKRCRQKRSCPGDNPEQQ